ncbi:hypothetical protein [Rosellinia necatrix fusagravirus 1]|uniref:Uncharacterized protein n=1 Tax=Rosellinia necatrix fusagravirus 1 TaxID=2056542 RepID=A0A2Z5WAE5_9VIRU|nr:hypothetical protein [Rosellinia necatrix fusagravirus 1]
MDSYEYTTPSSQSFASSTTTGLTNGSNKRDGNLDSQNTQFDGTSTHQNNNVCSDVKMSTAAGSVNLSDFKGTITQRTMERGRIFAHHFAVIWLQIILVALSATSLVLRTSIKPAELLVRMLLDHADWVEKLGVERVREAIGEAVGEKVEIAYVGRVHLPSTYKVTRSPATCLWLWLVCDLGFNPFVLALHGVMPWSYSITPAFSALLKSLGITGLPGKITWARKSHIHHVQALTSGDPLKLISLKTLTAFSFGAAEELTVTGSYTAKPIEALGGVHMAPTSLPAERIASGGISRIWDWSLWPTSLLSERVVAKVFGGAGGDIGIERSSTFYRHFPSDTEITQLPERFESFLQSAFCFRVLGGDATPAAQFTRSFRPTVINPELRPFASDLAGYLSGEVGAEPFKQAAGVLGLNRFLYTRGNRIVVGWEANDYNRGLDIQRAYMHARVTEFRATAIRLWARYFVAVQARDLLRDEPAYARNVDDPSTRVAITHINAQYIPPLAGNPAVNPEAPLWTQAAQDGLAVGTKQFIDAQGMSIDQVAELVGVMSPLTVDNLPSLRLVNGDSYHFGQSRHSIPNQVDEIFVHWGTEPIPNANDITYIANSAHRFPEVDIVDSVIRIFAGKYGARSAIDIGCEYAMHKGVVYPVAGPRGIRGRKPSENSSTRYLYSDGCDEMHLPRDRTFIGYFTPFLTSGTLSDLAATTLAPEVNVRLMSAQALVAHTRATSLNWACKSITMLGDQWDARNVRTANQWVRNHIDAIVRDYYNSYDNAWSNHFANTTATQYSYSPSRDMRILEGQYVANVWQSFMVPTLTNHYHELWAMDMIPEYQILPYFDRAAQTHHVTVDANQPSIVGDMVTYNSQREVKVGRDTTIFPGRNHIGGGHEYNMQVYMAQGDFENNQQRWRFQPGVQNRPPMLPAYTQLEYSYQLANPWVTTTAQNVIWMEPIGSPFADFIQPGSLRHYIQAGNRLLAWAARENTTPGNGMAPDHVRRTYRASLGAPHQSLMVNYVAPDAVHQEVDPPADYSFLIVTRGSSYAGMILQQHNAEIIPAGTRIQPDRPTQTPFTQAYDIGLNPVAHAPVRITNSVRPRQSLTGEKRVQLQGNLRYEPKYPVWRDQVPDLQSYQVHAEAGQVTVDEHPVKPRSPKRTLKPAPAETVYPDSDTSSVYESADDEPAPRGQPHHGLSDIEVDQLLERIERDYAGNGHNINAAQDARDRAVDDDFDQYLKSSRDQRKLNARIAAARKAVQDEVKKLEQRTRQTKRGTSTQRTPSPRRQPHAPFSSHSGGLAPPTRTDVPVEQPRAEELPPAKHDVAKLSRPIRRPEPVVTNDSSAAHAQAELQSINRALFENPPDAFPRTVRFDVKDQIPIGGEADPSGSSAADIARLAAGANQATSSRTQHAFDVNTSPKN